MLCAELWDGLVSRLQQQRLDTGLERISLDNISPFKLFGLSLVSVTIHVRVYNCIVHYTILTIHCTVYM